MKKKIYIYFVLCFFERGRLEKSSMTIIFLSSLTRRNFFQKWCAATLSMKNLGNFGEKQVFIFSSFFLRNCGQSHPESVHSFEIFTLNDEKIFECIFYNAVCYALFQCCHHTVTAVAVHGATVMQVST